MYPFVVIRVKDVFTRPTAWFFYPTCHRSLVICLTMQRYTQKNLPTNE